MAKSREECPCDARGGLTHGGNMVMNFGLIRRRALLVVLVVVLLNSTAALTLTRAAPDSPGAPAQLLGGADLGAEQLIANASVSTSAPPEVVEPDVETE